ncbi:ABC transporter substrate-binding protein [Aquibacillus salsiterrae]|uniref:Extracellular solute-binding protein n=1 Tax=Aquibacillus salsiterrae TaxID=2950439 RepID=A0A9X4AFC7_9BACI|nr:extracellular solute-binding protein [Aquibacillus salsiterrae]MDC3415913.1 extracellular solute-binding protein [Aquibacillus salsiterrae]
MRQVKLNWLTFLVGAVLFMFLLVGCNSSEGETASGDDSGGESGSETSSGSDDGGTSDEPVELSILVSETASTPGFKKVLEGIERDLNIKTKVEVRPGGPEGENIVKTRLATGEMSDLTLFNSGSLLMALNPEKYFVNLSNEPFMDRIMDSYKPVVTSNGKLFGIPARSSQVGAWLYNKKIYKELNLEVPKTWDELMENNEKIKAAGKTAVIGTYGETWTSQLPILADYYNVQAEVPDFADSYTEGEAKYSNTPQALRGFARIQEIGERGFMNEDYTVATYDQGMKMLAEGTGAHYPMLTQVLPLIAENFGDKVNDIGAFPQPSDDPSVNGHTVWMPDAIMINKETEKLEAAKKWLEYYISEEGIAAYQEGDKSIGPFVIKGVDLPEDAYPAVKELVPYFESGNVAPALEFVSPIKGPNLPQICTSVGSGQMTAEEAAKMYDDDVKKQAKQLGLNWD